jgi:hypothetical protein
MWGLREQGFEGPLYSGAIHCCQVAEIPAKKLKRGRRKKKLAERICGRILADFTKKWQEGGRGKFSKEVPYF